MSLFLIRYFFWLLQCLVTLGVVGKMVEQEGGAEIPNPRVLAQTKTNRPLVSPDTYSGDRNWTDWVEHFEAAALVNGWDEPTKLLWLPVRLTGKAQTAWRRLAPEAKQDFQAAKDALQKRFEPESKRQLYVVEFQTGKGDRTNSGVISGMSCAFSQTKRFPELTKRRHLCSFPPTLNSRNIDKIISCVVKSSCHCDRLIMFKSIVKSSCHCYRHFTTMAALPVPVLAPAVFPTPDLHDFKYSDLLW